MAQTQKALKLVLATLLWLMAVDAALNLVLLPRWPWAGKLESVSRYFAYGLSVEGKIAKNLTATQPGADAVLKAGWLDPSSWTQLPVQPAAAGADGRLVAVYGQSFALNAARAMAEKDPRITLRMIAGPAAPLSYAYAAYRADTQGAKAPVVVLGVLASSLARSGQFSMTAGSFENPAPFTFPRFSLDGQTLVEQAPVIHTYPEFLEAFRARGPLWQKFRAQLFEGSPSLDSFVFDAGWWDASTAVRLIRRGWVASQDDVRQGAADAHGLFPAFAAQVPVALSILTQAQQLALSRQQHLVVLLINDRGYAGSLDETLGKPLQAKGIHVLSSSDSINSRDLANFVADGHFTQQANQRFARTLGQGIEPYFWPPQPALVQPQTRIHNSK